HGLPGGHFVQVHIQGLQGQSDLYTAPENITNAVQEFMHPDPAAPARANAAALNEKYRPKVHGINPRTIFVTVLNANGVTGSAATAGTQLHERSYQILQPPNKLPADSPDGWNHTRTRVFFDPSQKNAKAAAKQVAKLFTDASTGPLTPRFQPYANGAELVVAVGKSYDGSLVGSNPTAPPPRHEPPHTIHNPSATRSLMRAIRHRLPFRVEYPTVIDRSSRVDPEPPNPRVYTVQGHRMARPVFSTGSPGQAGQRADRDLRRGLGRSRHGRLLRGARARGDDSGRRTREDRTVADGGGAVLPARPGRAAAAERRSADVYARRRGSCRSGGARLRLRRHAADLLRRRRPFTGLDGDRRAAAARAPHDPR